jgi:para-nitrobenzyl esterase
MRAIDSVSLGCGKVIGELTEGGQVAVYKGIPYAAPPVGALRFCTPQPAVPWSGTLHADRYAAACLQPLQASDHLLAQFAFAATPECGISENCLYLNVWTPAGSSADQLPVIVWLHGGAFRLGSGSSPVSEGEGLARHGVIVVTINYRLGALGFLAHPALSAESGASGNYGLQDVIAALRWVQGNIAAFGGNPDCVTVFGQSSGGALVNLLMASDAAQGLIHRAIVHSGGRMSGGPLGVMRRLSEAEQAGQRFMQTLGAAHATDLRRVAADTTYGVPRQWSPIVDGLQIKSIPQHIFDRGAQLRIPLLCGYTKDDASVFGIIDWQTRAGFEKYLRDNFPRQLDQLLKYYAVGNDADALRASFELRRDLAFAYQPWKLANSHAVCDDAPVFLFEFNRAVPLPPAQHYRHAPPWGFGAYHGAELWYVFNTQHHQPTFQWTDADRELADQLCAYWANFARSGDPNGGALAPWPRFDIKVQRAMLLGGGQHDIASCRAGEVSNRSVLNLYAQHFAAALTEAR